MATAEKYGNNVDSFDYWDGTVGEDEQEHWYVVAFWTALIITFVSIDVFVKLFGKIGVGLRAFGEIVCAPCDGMRLS